MRRGNGAYPPEFRAQVVQAYEGRQTATFESIGRDFGCAAESVRRWVKHAAITAGDRASGEVIEADTGAREVLWIARGELAIIRDCLEQSEAMLDALAARYDLWPMEDRATDPTEGIEF